MLFMVIEKFKDGDARINNLSREIAESWGRWAEAAFTPYGLLPSPDVHTPGWLNYNELREALTQAGLKIEGQSVEFRAVIAAMEELAREYGEEAVRLVFWFDG